jgi:hypothetical protein
MTNITIVIEKERRKNRAWRKKAERKLIGRRAKPRNVKRETID